MVQDQGAISLRSDQAEAAVTRLTVPQAQSEVPADRSSRRQGAAVSIPAIGNDDFTRSGKSTFALASPISPHQAARLAIRVTSAVVWLGFVAISWFAPQPSIWMRDIATTSFWLGGALPLLRIGSLFRITLLSAIAGPRCWWGIPPARSDRRPDSPRSTPARCSSLQSPEGRAGRPGALPPGAGAQIFQVQHPFEES